MKETNNIMWSQTSPNRRNFIIPIKRSIKRKWWQFRLKRKDRRESINKIRNLKVIIKKILIGMMNREKS